MEFILGIRLPHPARKRKTTSLISNKMRKILLQPSTSVLPKENATNFTILNVFSLTNSAESFQIIQERQSKTSPQSWSSSDVPRITATNAMGWTQSLPSWRPIAVYDAVGVIMINVKIKSSFWGLAMNITTSVLHTSQKNKLQSNSLNRSSSLSPIRKIN